MPWLPRTPSEPALIAVAVPDYDIVALDMLIDTIERAKPEGEDRRPEDIIFAVGSLVMARYDEDQLRNLLKEKP